MSFRLKKELALILSQNLADQCGGLFEGKCDAYVLMKIGTNEAEVLRGNRTHKILDDDNPRMTLPSDGYTEKLREYTFRVRCWNISSFTLFKDIVKRNGSLRVELRLGVFDFNGWSEDKPIGKVDTVESHLEHIDHYFQAKHVFEDVLKLSSTPTDPIVKSICRPELIKVGADVLANVRLRIVYSYNLSFIITKTIFRRRQWLIPTLACTLAPFLF